jgi:hypothetical protein
MTEKALDEQESLHERTMRLRRENEAAARARHAKWEQAGGERAWREQEQARQQGHTEMSWESLASLRWENLFSLRMWFGALIVGAIVSVPFALIWGPLGTVALTLGVVGMIAFQLSPQGTVFYCPYCRKRVKAGASTCHHCGRTVTS